VGIIGKRKYCGKIMKKGFPRAPFPKALTQYTTKGLIDINTQACCNGVYRS
jgi:hypothetical protein